MITYLTTKPPKKTHNDQPLSITAQTNPTTATGKHPNPWKTKATIPEACAGFVVEFCCCMVLGELMVGSALMN